MGFEIFVNGSSADSDYALVFEDTETFAVDINAVNSYGINFLPGIRLNNATKLYARFGYNWSTIDIVEVDTDVSFTPMSFDESISSHGNNYGVGIETAAFYDNFSLRAEYSHINYNKFHTKGGTEIKASNNQFMGALIYHVA